MPTPPRRVPNEPGAARLLGIDRGELTHDSAGGPLWFVLEDALLRRGDRAIALAALGEVDAWAAWRETYMITPRGACRLTLGGAGSADDARLPLLDAYASALAAPRYTETLTAFLDDWRERVLDRDARALAFETPGEQIGVALLALARGSGLPERAAPMVRPFHTFEEFSTIPMPVLREVAASLPPQQRPRLE